LARLEGSFLFQAPVMTGDEYQGLDNKSGMKLYSGYTLSSDIHIHKRNTDKAKDRGKGCVQIAK
jgi:hypothetical protein